MWPLLVELSSEISDSSHAGQKIFARWQQISTATILVWISTSERSQKLLSVPWGTQTRAHTAVKGRAVSKVQVWMLCWRETWKELRPSEPHYHQCLKNYKHTPVELINEHIANHVLRGFAGAEEHPKAAFKKWKANVQTYSKTFWKEWTLWTAGKNRRPVFDINLRGREDEDYSVCPWKEGSN